jgi:hypothetical protein
MTLIVAKLRYTVYRYREGTAWQKNSPKANAVKNALPPDLINAPQFQLPISTMLVDQNEADSSSIAGEKFAPHG